MDNILLIFFENLFLCMFDSYFLKLFLKIVFENTEKIIFVFFKNRSSFLNLVFSKSLKKINNQT